MTALLRVHTTMERTVMIADDSSFLRNLLRSILEMGGFTVVAEAADGAEAVEKYREHRPAVTIMDIIMPRKNGIEATREIVALNGEAKVVMCSTVSGEELAIAARWAGARDVIPKPFTAEQVREVVGRLIC